MKPSWDEAPEWANWLAMDEDGLWYWYEHEPEKLDFAGIFFVYSENSKHQNAALPVKSWGDTLERRP